MFDDALTSEYTEGFAYMNARGLVGTIYAPTSLVGTAGYCTWEQLQAMDAAGWSVANHAQTHTILTTLTQAEVEAELSGAKADLENNSLPNAAAHVAYPNGGVNATVRAAMTATGMLTGRTILTGPYAAGDDAYNIPGPVFDAGTQARIEAETTPQIVPVLFHGLSGAPLAAFQAFIDWLVTNNYELVTIEDMYVG